MNFNEKVAYARQTVEDKKFFDDVVKTINEYDNGVVLHYLTTENDDEDYLYQILAAKFENGEEPINENKTFNLIKEIYYDTWHDEYVKAAMEAIKNDSDEQLMRVYDEDNDFMVFNLDNAGKWMCIIDRFDNDEVYDILDKEIMERRLND